MTEESDSQKPSSKADTVMLLIQEMLIDVLGILMPGFCFVFLTCLATGIPLFALVQELSPAKTELKVTDFSSYQTLVIICLFIFSFVAGYLLYRQDPKRPDRKSIERTWEKNSTGCVRLWKDELDNQFPYGHLKEYLLDRGFHQLAELVKWSGKDPCKVQGTRE